MHYDILVDDITKGHRWTMVDIFPDSSYCNVGHFPIKHGARCDSCGICVADQNMKKANRSIYCKPSSLKGDVTYHQWIPGNLPSLGKCYVCLKDCVDSGLNDLRCCWCKRTVHDGCQPDSEACDFGHYHQIVVPPNCVELKRVGIKGRRHLVVARATRPRIDDWKPLIVLGNRKSGNNDGEKILCSFRGILNPAQVIDLCDRHPENALEWCHLLPDVVFRVLVCGGDGSVGWVLNAIENLKLKTTPEVGILPLGTGNDLSRVLGWGEGHDTDEDISDAVDQVIAAKVVQLDRWKITVNHRKHLGISRPKKEVIMNNYASLGVDALVTLNFHKQRQSRPWLFANRVVNKLCYFTYGTKDCLERECKNLHEKIKVELDGEEIELTEIEGIVVLNIASWGGGCRPWELAENKDDFKPAKYDDGYLEVMALYSSFHIAQLQVGMASPLILGQAKTVKITLKDGNAPMQVDGEPWEQHPAEIVIRHHRKATVLARQDFYQ